MTRSHGFLIACIVGLRLSGLDTAFAAPRAERHEIAAENTDEGLVGPATAGVTSKTLQDTVWIADWTFDAPGGGCTETGWFKWDNRILNVHNDSEFWHIDNRFDGVGPIVGRAAILSHHNLCWAQHGYGNDNDFSIILKYSGSTATLDFDKMSDSEPTFDFVTVEADSLGLSESFADPSINAKNGASFYRDLLLFGDGPDLGSHVAVSLPAYGPGTHEVYIRFVSDDVYSDEDGDYPTFLQAGLVVDNIVVTGGTAYTENFEGALNPNVILIETANPLPFLDAPWLRTFSHITDNDVCAENLTCAWLGTNPNRPADNSQYAFGPGGVVIRNWLDDIVASPWVSLASTPFTATTVLSFRRFPGSHFSLGAIVQSWRVRAKVRTDNTDTQAPGDSFECVSPWGHAAQWNSLDQFFWLTSIFDMTPYFDPTGFEIQVSFRTSDWQYIAGSANQFLPGPGPFWDRVRIGRRVLTAPAMHEGTDSRSQAQDAFPTVVDPSIVGGEHFVPDGANRFGTCAFSQGADLGINTASTRLVTGDSIWLSVSDTRNAGGIASVRFFGAITAGVHAGKVPGPYATVGGFFEVTADSARDASGAVVADRWFVDLDDTYYRGGDVMKYFWAATDNLGAFASMPAGLTASPASVAEAETATGGLHEVSYLPAMNWDAGYQAAVAAHPTGDVDPTPAQIAASTQANCMLYYQKHNSRRRSGQVNRTTFMYTLDNLGYAGAYDVYDVQGYGNTVNQIAGRANVTQCSGYALIIQDDGRSNLVPNIPNGENNDGSQLRQADWYRSYLAQGVSGPAGTASFWSIGENTGFLHRANPLFSTDFRLSGVVTNQGLTVNPTVRGKTTNTWASGAVTDFTGDEFTLNGGCPAIRIYDAANAGAGATITHRYALGATEGSGAVVMNRNAALRWNTVWMGFPWFDIRFAGAPTDPPPQQMLAKKVIEGTIPVACQHDPNPTDIGSDPPVDAVPPVTALHPNVPNPFNPATNIEFDLAAAGRVQLRIYDVSGKLVRTLVDETRPAGRYAETWTGLDAAGARIASGVYFYRLDTTGFAATRKMVLLQ